MTYRLEDRDGHVVLVGGGGELPVGAGALKGYVEKIEKQDGSLVVSGWAEDTRRGRPAKSILVFGGDRFLAEVRPTVPRADLPHPSGTADPVAGFTAGPLGDDRRCRAHSRVRRAGRTGGRAAAALTQGEARQRQATAQSAARPGLAGSRNVTKPPVDRRWRTACPPADAVTPRAPRGTRTSRTSRPPWDTRT